MIKTEADDEATLLNERVNLAHRRGISHQLAEGATIQQLPAQGLDFAFRFAQFRGLGFR